MDIVKIINILVGIMLCGFVIFVAEESFSQQPKKDQPRLSVLIKKKGLEVEEKLIKNIFVKEDPQLAQQAGKPPHPARASVTPHDASRRLPNILAHEHGTESFYDGQNSPPPNRDYITKLRQKIQTQDGFWAPPPSGFFSGISKSYLIYREQRQINEDLKNLLDHMHMSFFKEAVPFSIFVKFKKILMMLFSNKESYMAYTARPDWSLATVDIGAGAIYIMEGHGFKGTVVHELTHIVYDGFFLPRESPLWLSEGFSVYMQVMAQSKKENNWLLRNIDILRDGGYIDFDEFTAVTSLEGFGKEDIALWYAQAFSVVEYLINAKSKDQFYHFSKNMKDGLSVGSALFRAYGMPFNTLSALEHAWQADLQQQDIPKGAGNAK